MVLLLKEGKRAKELQASPMRRNIGENTVRGNRKVKGRETRRFRRETSKSERGPFGDCVPSQFSDRFLYRLRWETSQKIAGNGKHRRTEANRKQTGRKQTGSSENAAGRKGAGGRGTTENRGARDDRLGS